jgi:hypothetical protein
MTQQLDIIIVEKLGSLKMLSIKNFKEEELYKKCGFKKPEHFNKQTEWSVKCDGTKYYIQVFAKAEGKANNENKYDFPPPIDTKLFYGSCCIVGQIKKEDGTKTYVNLSIAIWNKIYEKLFGGFEDLAATAKEDEEEEDELDNIPKEKKTKQGYLKDGFVVDSSDTEEGDAEYTNSEYDDDGECYEEEDEDESETIYEDIGSELSEESYDYNDDNVAKS